MMSVQSEMVELSIRRMAQAVEKETTEVIHA